MMYLVSSKTITSKVYMCTCEVSANRITFAFLTQKHMLGFRAIYKVRTCLGIMACVSVSHASCF